MSRNRPLAESWSDVCTSNFWIDAVCKDRVPTHSDEQEEEVVTEINMTRTVRHQQSETCTVPVAKVRVD